MPKFIRAKLARIKLAREAAPAFIVDAVNAVKAAPLPFDPWAGVRAMMYGES